MFTKEERRLHDEYDQAPADDQRAINRAFMAMRKVLQEDGRKLCNGDRAEVLVAAIWRYYKSQD